MLLLLGFGINNNGKVIPVFTWVDIALFEHCAVPLVGCCCGIAVVCSRLLAFFQWLPLEQPPGKFVRVGLLDHIESERTQNGSQMRLVHVPRVGEAAEG